MTVWEKIILDQLHSYPRWKKAVDYQIPAEITALKRILSDMQQLKATNLDKMPSGGETQEDRILSALAKIDYLERERVYRAEDVKNIEEKLAALPQKERRVLDMIILNVKADDLALEMGYQVRQIYNIRTDALRHYAQLMGAE